MAELGKIRIAVWTEPHEHDVIEALAAAAKLPISTYLRTLALKVHSAGMTLAEITNAQGGQYLITGRKYQ